jgi:hypothetical protein
MTWPHGVLQDPDWQTKLGHVWRKVVEGRKVLVGQNMMGRDICVIPVDGKPNKDWRGHVTCKQRTMVVRWIIENMKNPWEYL